MYLEIHKSARSRQFWFVVKSLGNHKVLATSEMYARKNGAVKAAQIILEAKNTRYYDKTDD